MKRDPRTNQLIGGPKPLRGVRIACVYPPFGPVKNEPGIKVVKENYGIFPNLSLLYAAGTLEEAGAELIFIDAQAEGIGLDDTVARLKEFDPTLVCYTITTYLFYQTLRWMEAIKQAFPRPVIAGGVHMSVYPKESMTHRAIDYAVTGEAEMSLIPLVEAILAGEKDLSHIKGIVYRNERDEIIETPHSNSLNPVDDAPFPSRHLLDNSLYFSFISQYKNFSAIITSRGCPYKCIFCEQGAKAFRGRSAENVVNELEYSYKEHGIREFDFFDSSFTIQKKRVEAICQEIIRRKLPIVWSARTRADCVDKETLRIMNKAGCMRIYYGIESGNADILRTLLKESELDEIKDVVKETRKAGINAFGYFMIGNPGETRDTIRETINFAKNLDLDYVQFSKVTPMPATELYSMYMNETGRDYWREYIISEEVDEYLTRPGTSLSEREIQDATRQAYIEFYYRPRYMLKALWRMRSGEEFKRSARVAWEMVAGT